MIFLVAGLAAPLATLLGLSYAWCDSDSGNVAEIRRAAEQGTAEAQFSLGSLYAWGQGVPKDDKEAHTWYRKAVGQGFPPAQDALRKFGKSHAATTAVSKEDIRAMILAAMKEAADGQARARKSVNSDVDTPGYTTPENPKNFAIVIGAEKYASLPAADFSKRDADAVRAHLMALGYPARNIFFLTDQQATRAKVTQALNTWLPQRVGKDSTVFFFYSGHGAPDTKTGQAYLVGTDGDPEDLESTAYPVSMLYGKLGGLKARQVIVALDSCFSGTGGRSVLPRGRAPWSTRSTWGSSRRRWWC